MDLTVLVQQQNKDIKDKIVMQGQKCGRNPM